MDREFDIARLESYIDEIKSRCDASDIRKKHINYFLDGIRAEAGKMVSTGRKAQYTEMVYGILPTLLYPLKGRIESSISENLGYSVSSAKSLYDNVNRFLQAAYSSEEEVVKREEQILASPSDSASAWGKAYDLKKISQLGESREPNVRWAANKFLKLYEGTDFVRTLRNATDHGHGHSLVEKGQNGYIFSRDFMKDSNWRENQKSVSDMLESLQTDYLGMANSFMGDIVEGDNNLFHEKSLTDLFKIAGYRAKHQANWTFKFLSKLYAPILAATLVIGVFDSNIHIQSKKHQDEKSRRQLEELVSFQKDTGDVTLQVKNLAECIDSLENNASVLMNYTNRPINFDSEKVEKQLKKLKKVSQVLKEE